MNKQKFVTSQSTEHPVTNIGHPEPYTANSDTSKSPPEEDKSSGKMTLLIIGSGLLTFAAVFLLLYMFNPATQRGKPPVIDSIPTEQGQALPSEPEAQESSKRLEYLEQLNQRLHGDQSLQARIAEQAATSATPVPKAPKPTNKATAKPESLAQRTPKVVTQPTAAEIPEIKEIIEIKESELLFEPIEPIESNETIGEPSAQGEYQAFGRRSSLGRSPNTAQDVLTLTNQELINAIDRFESNFETLDTKKMNAYDITTTPSSVELYSYLARNYSQIDLNLLEVDTGVAGNVRQVKMTISGLIDKKDKARKASKNWSTIQLTIEKQANNNIYITW